MPVKIYCKCLLACIFAWSFGGNCLKANGTTAKPVKKSIPTLIVQGIAETSTLEIASVDSFSANAIALLMDRVNSTIHTSINPQGVDLLWEVGLAENINVCQIEKWNGSNWEQIGVVQRSGNSGTSSNFLFHDITAGNGSNIYRVCLAHYQNSVLHSIPAMANVRQHKSLMEVTIKAQVSTDGKQMEIASAYHSAEAGKAFIFDSKGHYLFSLMLHFNSMGIATINLAEVKLLHGQYICLCNPNITEAIRIE